MSMITSGGDVQISIVGRLEGLNRAVEDAEKMMGERFGNISRQTGMAMTAMGGAITGALGLSVNKAAEFDQALTNAVSVTGLSGAAAEEAKAKMHELAIILGTETAWSATEVATAMYDLNSKGFDASRMSIAELTPFLSLASATQSDLARTTEIVTATLKGFGLENAASAQIADVLTGAIGKSAAKLDSFGQSMPIASAAAKVTGVSFTETAAALSVLYDNGVTASTAATGLRNVMMDLTNPTAELEKLFKRQGVAQEDTSLKTKTLAEVMEFLAGKGITAVEMLDAFGKENGTTASVLFENRKMLGDFTGALGETGGMAKQVADYQLNALSGQMQILRGSIEAVMITAGEALMPVLKSLTMSVIETVNAVAKWARENQPLTETLVKIAAAVGGLMLVLGPMLVMMPGIVATVTLFHGALALLPAVLAVAAAGITTFLAPVVAITAAVLTAGYAVANLIGWLRRLGQEEAAVEAPTFGFPMPPGLAGGGVVGLPGYAAGGRIGRDMEAFRWNEQGGEIAVAPVGSRILTHGESVRVARDAIREAMSGPGGVGAASEGGGMTVNITIDRPQVRGGEDLHAMGVQVEAAMNRAWARRSAWGRV